MTPRSLTVNVFCISFTVKKNLIKMHETSILFSLHKPTNRGHRSCKQNANASSALDNCSHWLYFEVT